MKRQPLKVGFDLDGVLLYNPARIFRPVIVFFKQLFLPEEKDKFHLPKTGLEKFIWWILHKSSFMPAPGLKDIESLVEKKQIKAYIVSARYESLKSDFNSWIKKIGVNKYFSGIYYNNNDEQPHLFKENMINKLKLDIFVEDNWDIVSHLFRKTKSEIFWIYNLFDRKIIYKNKFSSLKKALLKINSMIN